MAFANSTKLHGFDDQIRKGYVQYAKKFLAPAGWGQSCQATLRTICLQVVFSAGHRISRADDTSCSLFRNFTCASPFQAHMILCCASIRALSTVRRPTSMHSYRNTLRLTIPSYGLTGRDCLSRHDNFVRQISFLRAMGDTAAIHHTTLQNTHRVYGTQGAGHEAHLYNVRSNPGSWPSFIP